MKARDKQTDKQEAEASGRGGKSRLTLRIDHEKALKAVSGSLWRLLCTEDEDTVKVTVTQKEDTYLAIGTRYWETEQKFVCFASGETILEALLGLAGKWYQRDAWKPEKPWDGGSR